MVEEDIQQMEQDARQNNSHKLYKMVRKLERGTKKSLLEPSNTEMETSYVREMRCWKGGEYISLKILIKSSLVMRRP